MVIDCSGPVDSKTLLANVLLLDCKGSPPIKPGLKGLLLRRNPANKERLGENVIGSGQDAVRRSIPLRGNHMECRNIFVQAYCTGGSGLNVSVNNYNLLSK